MQVFHILADLAWEQRTADAEPEAHVLLQVKAAADGSIQLSPPVVLPGQAAGLPDDRKSAGTHRFRARDGAQYEYTVRLLGALAEEDQQVARRNVLWKRHEHAHAQRARQVQRDRFVPARRVKLLIQGDIAAAEGFEQNRLYVEFALRFPKTVWRLKGPAWLLHQHEQLEGAFEDESTAHVRSVLL